jgi:2-oxoglutarate ferredoxin oxidoreductase subunit beta
MTTRKTETKTPKNVKPKSAPEATVAISDVPENAAADKPKRTMNDYKSGVKPIWCPGCGHYGALSAFLKGLAANDIDPKDMTLVSGIGCSGRFSHFVKGYCFHGLHGRVLPVCQGIALSTRGILTCGISGDGDAMAIGGGHIPHVARRNPHMVYIVLDNGIYGLTKGQFSPTTREASITATSPYGILETRMDPLSLFLAYDASFVARGFSANNKQLATIMAEAIRHRGFSVVHVLSPCVTFNKQISYDYLSSVVQELPDEFDKTDKVQAFKYAQDPEKIYTGIFYQLRRPTLGETHDKAIEVARKMPNAGNIEALMDNYR